MPKKKASKRQRRHRLPTDKELAKAEGVEDLPLVRVHWDDANGLHFWRNFEEARQKAKLSPIVSVGYLLKRTREIVLLFSGAAKDKIETRANGFTTIPASNITKIEVIEHIRNP